MDGINGQHHQQKIYFSLIQKAGSWNRYQFSLFVVLYVICLLNISINSMLPYLFQQIDYKCHGLEGDECSDYVCSLPMPKRQQYVVQDNYISLADDLNMDFRCEHYHTAGLMYLAISVTIIFEKLFFSSFSDYFGRKNALLFTTTLMLVGLCSIILGAWIHSVYVSIGGLLVAAFSSANSFQCAICIATEVIAQQKRIDYLSWLGTTRGIGLIFNVIVFNRIKDWLSVIIFIFVAPLVFIIISVAYFVEKTPFDLLSFAGQAQIIQTLRRIAIINRENFSLTIAEVKSMKNDYLHLFTNNSVQHFSILDLFRYRSLLKIIFPLMILNLLAGYIYYSSPLLVDNSSTTITDPLSSIQAKYSIVDGIAAIAALFLCCLVYKSMLKKKVKILVGLAMLVFQLYFLLFSDQLDQEINVIIYLFYGILAASGFFYINLLNFQMFPTQIRPIGVVFVSLFQDMSDLLQPLTNQIYENSSANYNILLILATTIGVITLFLMKGQNGDSNPQIIEEIMQQNGEFELKQ